MRIHHFYPRSNNIGDHFVQRGIAAMIRGIVSAASFNLFDVNSRGQDKTNYGLTQSAVERANREADLVVIGGSNLYEGSLGWPWGVHLDPHALENLHVPLFLLGLGTGSSFNSPLHKPSRRAKAEIRLVNDCATLSGVRDVTTLDWLQQLGVTKAKLMGDPAAFIFNHAAKPANRSGPIMITLPPRRVWTSKRQLWNVRANGRAVFSALVGLTQKLLDRGEQCIVVCNDPLDLEVAGKLFGSWLPRPVVCPQTPEEYFQLLAQSRAVISGRLHTAVVSFSLGIPFLLIDVDQRTRGFLNTYQLQPWAITPSRSGVERRLNEQAEVLLSDDSQRWQSRIDKRDEMYYLAMNLLRTALREIS
jgi:polysaccharide pyruvyl transferase WcaK-like protein